MYMVPAVNVEHRVKRSTGEVLWKITRYSIKTGIKSGSLLGGCYGTFVFPIIGTIVGAIIGLIAGLILGLISGLLLGSITTAWFYPNTRINLYRQVMTGISSATNLLGGFFLIVWVHASWQNNTLLEVADETKFFILLPTLIAALTPLFWRNRYIKWYIANL
jgi:eukaryotic-like serine/threonine-protein kinase